MIGELIKDFFLRRTYPKLVKQSLEIHFSKKHIVKGPLPIDCPECGATLHLTRMKREYSWRPWKIDIVCPSCNFEIRKINTYGYGKDY